MNPLKSQVKIGTAFEIGCRFDDVLESAKAEQFKYEGASGGLQQAAQSVEALTQHVDKDVDAELFDLTTAGHIKKYLIRAHQVVLNLSKQADNNRMISMGKVQALESSVKIVKKIHDDEVTKVENLRQAMALGQAVPDDGSVPTAPVPQDPTRKIPIKERRLAEAAAEAAAAAEAPATDAAPSDAEGFTSPPLGEVFDPPPSKKTSAKKTSAKKRASRKG